MKLLLIPLETSPCQESFLEEVFTRSNDELETVFLMPTAEGAPPQESWNCSRVTSFPARPSSKLVRALKSYVADLRYCVLVPRAIRRERPDVVLVRDVSLPLVIALMMQRTHGHAVYYQKTYPHEMRWFDSSIYGAYRLPRIWLGLRRFENWLLHKLMAHCELIIPITEAMGEELIASHGYDATRVRAYGMGVQGGRLETLRAGREPHGPGDQIRLCYAGTLGPTRRMDLMVEAFATALARRTDRDLRLSVFGGEPQDIERLRTQAESLGVADLVRFHGLIPRERLYTELMEQDVGLTFIPAGPRYWISSPTKQIEYLSLGMPSVSTNTVAQLLPVAERTTAMVLTEPTVEAFAAGIQTVCDDLDGHRLAAQAARPQTIRDFSYEGMRASFLNLVRASIGGRS